MKIEAAIEPECLTCRMCGKCDGKYIACEEYTRMLRDTLCFQCAFWELRAEHGCPTVIDHCVYTPGTRTSGEWRGMGGRKFDIEYFDGRTVTTSDLWVGGVIPERWRERIPDTARFLNGAQRVDMKDGGSAWDASSSQG